MPASISPISAVTSAANKYSVIIRRIVCQHPPYLPTKLPVSSCNDSLVHDDQPHSRPIRLLLEYHPSSLSVLLVASKATSLHFELRRRTRDRLLSLPPPPQKFPPLSICCVSPKASNQLHIQSDLIAFRIRDGPGTTPQLPPSYPPPPRKSTQ